jgi:Galactose oxidase, central domain
MSLRVALGLTMALIGLAACSGQPVSAPAPGISSLSASAASAEPSSPDLGVPRAVHSATTLADGRVLIAGGCTTPGCDGFDAARTIEIYDPRSRTLSEGPRLAAPRANHTATLLAGGRVLFTGGYPAEGGAPIATAEIYDPDSGQLTAAGRLLQERAGHTATLLKDGRVLIAGGFDVAGRALRTTEYFDPVAITFSAGPELTMARAAHVAARMGDRVVVVGGTSMDRALPSTDVFSHGTWQPGPSLMVGRVKHAALGLSGTELFVVGGSPTMEGEVLLDSTELVDLDTGRVSAGPRLSEGEYKLDGAVAALPDGRVVIAGGHRIDVYDPMNPSMTVLEDPALPRLSFRTVSVLDAHTVLLAGGYDASIVPTDQTVVVAIPSRPSNRASSTGTTASNLSQGR